MNTHRPSKPINPDMTPKLPAEDSVPVIQEDACFTTHTLSAVTIFWIILRSFMYVLPIVTLYVAFEHSPTLATESSSRCVDLVIPALFHRLSDPLSIFTAVVFVEIRGFNVGRRRGIGIVEETRMQQAVSRSEAGQKRECIFSLTFEYSSRQLPRRTLDSNGSAIYRDIIRQYRRRWDGTFER